ncbi:protein O-mannosyl-transferase TMTC1 [Procambarus clarkii]|uniref:protein O-mannosyl-transferase TMTC1 n=1 Tax=Procambarus clarkii TaxID=6728 RepID=UPI001E6778F4|nr:protein O-mannosyl-transferase TMTC1-like [Procambarus clarkii]
MDTGYNQYSPRRKRKPSPHSGSPSSCPPSTSPSWWPLEAPPHAWLYLTAWLAGVLVYINGLTGDFVHDDISSIKTNPDVLGTAPISSLFFNDYWGRSMADPLSHKSYRPVTILTFRLNHLVLGPGPVGFHLVNVGLHSCACLLLTRLLLRLLHLPRATVLSVSLIFATHPVHTEAVTGLVGRADILATLTFLATILAYHRAIMADYEEILDAEGGGDEGEGSRAEGEELNVRKDDILLEEPPGRSSWNASRRGAHGIVPEGIGVTGEGNTTFDGKEGDREGKGSLLWVGRTGMVAGLGTLCKEHALTALLVCVAWDLTLHTSHLSRTLRQQSTSQHLRLLLKRVFWLGVAGAAILSFRLWMMRGAPPAFTTQDNPACFSSSLLTRVLTLWYLPALNAWLLLCPWTLAHDWQMGSIPLLTSIGDPRNMVSLAFYLSLLLILRAGVLAKGHESKAMLLGLSLLVLPFLPATNLLFAVGFVVAERILYIPSLGYAVLVGLGLSRLGRLRAPCLVLLLLVFSCRTLHRNRDWESRETLFLAGLRTLPHNAKMHYNFANLQKDLGNVERAKFHYREAIRLWPGHWSAHNNLGTLLNDTSEAENHFQMALKAHPQHAHAHYNLANLRQKQGRVSEAMALLEESLRHDATSRDAVSVLAGLYVDVGRPDDAEKLHLALLAGRPSDPAVHNNYAAFLQRIGRGEAALRHYEAALALDPDHKVALVNTARLMTSLHHDNQAKMLYKRALAVAWEAEVGESLGKLYLNNGRLEDAEATFISVLSRYPQMLSSKVYLARVKLQQRNYHQSEELLREVLNQAPGQQEALFQLSLLYTHTNRTQDALVLAQQAAHNCSIPPTLCAHLLAHYGDLLSDKHNIDEAAQSYLLAVELEPTLTHAHVNLGALYHTKGDYILAWRHYMMAHGQEPLNTLLLENMEKLRRLQHLQASSGIPHCFNKS